MFKLDMFRNIVSLLLENQLTICYINRLREEWERHADTEKEYDSIQQNGFFHLQ